MRAFGFDASVDEAVELVRQYDYLGVGVYYAVVALVSYVPSVGT